MNSMNKSMKPSMRKGTPGKKSALRAKMQSRRGESFVEILIAILIVSLGCLLIATMYTSSMNLNLKASEQDDAFYQAVTETEQMFSGTPSENGKAVITEEGEGGKSFDVGIDTYGDSCHMELDDDGLLTIVQTSTGTSAEGEPTTAKKSFYPIGSAAYDEVKVKSLSFTVTTTDSATSITCTLEITSDGTNTLWEKSVTIVPLYQKA